MFLIASLVHYGGVIFYGLYFIPSFPPFISLIFFGHDVRDEVNDNIHDDFISVVPPPQVSLRLERSRIGPSQRTPVRRSVEFWEKMS